MKGQEHEKEGRDFKFNSYKKVNANFNTTRLWPQRLCSQLKGCIHAGEAKGAPQRNAFIEISTHCPLQEHRRKCIQPDCEGIVTFIEGPSKYGILNVSGSVDCIMVNCWCGGVAADGLLFLQGCNAGVQPGRLHLPSAVPQAALVRCRSLHFASSPVHYFYRRLRRGAHGAAGRIHRQIVLPSSCQSAVSYTSCFSKSFTAD